MPIAQAVYGAQATARLATLGSQADARIRAQRQRLSASGGARLESFREAELASRRGGERRGYPREAAQAMLDGIKAACPVITGRLRRSFRLVRMHGSWRPRSLLIYARPVDTRGKSRGYSRRGLRRARAAIRRELSKAGGGFLPIPQSINVRTGRFSRHIEESIRSWVPVRT